MAGRAVRRNRKLRQPRIDGIDLVKRYGEVEGVLSSKTPIAGSGWWRLRLVQSAAMKCVIAGDPCETLPIAATHSGHAPREIESLNLRNRRELARHQSKNLRSAIIHSEATDRPARYALVKEGWLLSLKPSGRAAPGTR